MAYTTALVACCLVAVSAAASLHSDIPFSVRAGAAPAFQETVGPTLPPDTEYTATSVSKFHLALSIVNVAIRSATTYDECYAEATSRGADVFEFKASKERCNLASLQFPMCESRSGSVEVFIRPQFLSNGTTDDGVNVEQLYKGALLWSVLSNPAEDYGTFRVENPTILSFPDLLETPSTGLVQTIFTEEDSEKLEIDDDILVDPACYSTSACAVPFVYPARETQEIPRVLSDFCGSTIWVGENEVLNFVSHERMGCENFPDVGYNRTGCRINYRGVTPITFKISYFNFVGDDKCDGFYLSILAFYEPSKWTVTKLCDNPLTEIESPNPRGRIDFGKTSLNQRPKYGFKITIISE